MRAWENRPDTYVCDEPFYAHYLLQTKVAHPGADEVIAHQENDWRKVAEYVTGPVPEGKAIFYQKHMAHHLLPNMGREWLHRLTHCFLIRDPGEMLLSLDKIFSRPRIEDTGLPQQVEIFEGVRARTGKAPAIVDARDLLTNPRGMLAELCRSLEVPFYESMLSWPPGRRPTDGIWAKHWYDAVEVSTGFKPYQPQQQVLPPHLEALHRECLEYYEVLHADRLTAD
jgi:hypothetical protein